MARKLKVAPATLCRFLAGKAPSAKLIDRLVEFLGLELHQQVKEAAEGLKYTIETVRYTRVDSGPPHFRGEPGKQEVIDIEPFLEELKEIFGGPSGEPLGR